MESVGRDTTDVTTDERAVSVADKVTFVGRVTCVVNATTL